MGEEFFLKSALMSWAQECFCLRAYAGKATSYSMGDVPSRPVLDRSCCFPAKIGSSGHLCATGPTALSELKIGVVGHSRLQPVDLIARGLAPWVYSAFALRKRRPYRSAEALRAPEVNSGGNKSTARLCGNDVPENQRSAKHYQSFEMYPHRITATIHVHSRFEYQSTSTWTDSCFVGISARRFVSDSRPGGPTNPMPLCVSHRKGRDRKSSRPEGQRCEVFVLASVNPVNVGWDQRANARAGPPIEALLMVGRRLIRPGPTLGCKSGASDVLIFGQELFCLE